MPSKQEVASSSHAGRNESQSLRASTRPVTRHAAYAAPNCISNRFNHEQKEESNEEHCCSDRRFFQPVSFSKEFLGNKVEERRHCKGQDNHICRTSQTTKKHHAKHSPHSKKHRQSGAGYEDVRVRSVLIEHRGGHRETEEKHFDGQSDRNQRTSRRPSSNGYADQQAIDDDIDPDAGNESFRASGGPHLCRYPAGR